VRALVRAGNSAGFYGLMSANTTDINPFGDWNFVWVAYCDGSSQTSDRDQSVLPFPTLEFFLFFVFLFFVFVFFLGGGPLVHSVQSEQLCVLSFATG
jgi:hypothetical protein